MPLPDYLAGRDLDNHDCEKAVQPAILGNENLGAKFIIVRFFTVKRLRNSQQRFERWPNEGKRWKCQLRYFFTVNE